MGLAALGALRLWKTWYDETRGRNVAAVTGATLQIIRKSSAAGGHAWNRPKIPVGGTKTGYVCAIRFGPGSLKGTHLRMLTAGATGTLSRTHASSTQSHDRTGT